MLHYAGFDRHTTFTYSKMEYIHEAYNILSPQNVPDGGRLVALPSISETLCDIQAGRKDVLQSYIESGGNTRAILARGSTLLHEAAAVGNYAAVSLLCEGGVSLEATDDCGWTPLHDAVCSGELDTVKKLLQFGCHVNCNTTKEGRHSLLLAVESGHSSLIPLLLHYGADPTVIDKRGYSALFLAVAMKNVEASKAILQHTECLCEERAAAANSGVATVPRNNAIQIDTASVDDDTSFSNTPEMSANMRSLLASDPIYADVHKVLFNGAECVDLPMPAQSSPEADLSPLTRTSDHATSSTLGTDQVTSSTERAEGRDGVDCEADRVGPISLKNVLFQQHFHDCWTTLHAAVYADCGEIVCLLLSAFRAQGSINPLLIQDAEESTVLHLACERKCSVLSELLAFEPQWSCTAVSTVDIDGDTPFLVAILNGNSDAAVLILDFCAKYEGHAAAFELMAGVTCSALHSAADKSTVNAMAEWIYETVQRHPSLKATAASLLLAVNHEGNTVLHTALQCSDWKVANKWLHTAVLLDRLPSVSRAGGGAGGVAGGVFRSLCCGESSSHKSIRQHLLNARNEKGQTAADLARALGIRLDFPDDKHYTTTKTTTTTTTTTSSAALSNRERSPFFC